MQSSKGHKKMKERKVEHALYALEDFVVVVLFSCFINILTFWQHSEGMLQDKKGKDRV